MSASFSSYWLMRCPMMLKVCSITSSELIAACESVWVEILTAIMKSAPISRAKRTGTGATRPPST
ncbi:hypothetical protein D3C86_2238300 [compost metagenome]